MKSYIVQAFCHSGPSGKFFIFSPHQFVLKKDSQQTGMTEYAEKHEGLASLK